MKIVILGAGGVGGYFGAMLARSGRDVTFIARGRHLQEIRNSGLRVRSVHGDFVINSALATEDISSLGPVDLVLIAVKDFQLEPILSPMKTLINEASTIIPLLNGVRAAERLIEEFGRERVLGGLCRIVAYKEGPGIICQESSFRSIIFGEWDGQESTRARAILETLSATDIDVELTADIRKEMWTKYLFIAAYGAVSSVVRLPAGRIRSTRETMEILRKAMNEIAEVAQARSVTLESGVVNKALAFFDSFPPGATSSMQRDVQEGRMFELEALTGALVRYGTEVDVPTPVNDFLYAALKPHEMLAAELA
jgi:2-dehydropantoate 2-reductase